MNGNDETGLYVFLPLIVVAVIIIIGAMFLCN